jgi:hypothetical protein
MQLEGLTQLLKSLIKKLKNSELDNLHHKLYYKCENVMFLYEKDASFRSFCPLDPTVGFELDPTGVNPKPPFALELLNLPKCQPETLSSDIVHVFY